jgi:hypothetical protein
VSTPRISICTAILGSLSLFVSTWAFGQANLTGLSQDRTQVPAAFPRSFTPDPETTDEHQSSNAVGTQAQVHREGLIVRSLKRGLQDQKQLYSAPFKAPNLKWDIGFLAGSAALFATDMHIERAVPTTHLDVYHNISAVSLVGIGVTSGSLWAYGIKTDNEHAKETGELELETLANTFLIYAPMQLVAGRERPDEGRGGGRFLVQHSFNTSFPAGHPMFSWAMASVVAHEYPRPWVALLAYGAATSVSVSRIMGRNHFASDVFVGSALGYLIGSHIFHARCSPELSEDCQQKIRGEHWLGR